MGNVLFWIVAAAAAVWGHAMIRNGRARAVLIAVAGTAAACLLIWASAGSLPGIHRAALSSLAVLWGLPFCAGTAAGALAGWLRKPA